MLCFYNLKGAIRMEDFLAREIAEYLEELSENKFQSRLLHLCRPYFNSQGPSVGDQK